MRLYWVDAFFDKIEHSNFDGQSRLSLDRITQISHPFGLTIFEGNMSWRPLGDKVVGVEKYIWSWWRGSWLSTNCCFVILDSTLDVKRAITAEWDERSKPTRRCSAAPAGYAYFTDWRLGGIVRVRKTDGGEMVVIRRGISHIMHVKSFNSNAQIGE